ncbi:G-type lectin S-receptor-like serine/threonine-protein kinase SD1-29 [Cardamine amara subsp. amara]|uniref:Receptor-like serine/threonine-protein kinase n=1 Tax=Cardamine amara subsp. amara TaxID=228776 RepID=A0ABD1BHM6_CARAN
MRKMSMFLFACSLLLIIFPTCCYAAINPSNPLSIGQTLSSPAGFFELGFFSPNNTRNWYVGIWFKEIVPRVIVWVANRDTPVTKSAANLTISSNGSLVLLEGEQDLVWSTGEAFISNKCHVELLDTGNLVVIDDVPGKRLWQSFENLGDTMLPQSSLMYDIPNGKKRMLTPWKSNSDPSPGDFSLEITPQVPLQGLIRRGSVPYWRTGPWAKTRFSGLPTFDESYVSPFSVVQDLATSTGSVTYSMLRNFNLSYTTITSEGQIKIYWNDGKRWMHHFTAPGNSCDIYGQCGPFGLCVRATTPRCICLKGFVPKSDEEWRKGNWTSGCVRRTQLSCKANSSMKTQGRDKDTFYRMTNVKTPDLYQFLSFFNAEQCYEGCLGNCSCTAFAYITGIGCLVWNEVLLDTVQFLSNGEILSIRLASSELAGSSRTKIIVGTTASLSIFLILVVAAFLFWRYRAKHNDAWNNDFEPQDVAGITFFEMRTLRTATNNFSSSNKLGQGGFGPVYKGKLPDGKEIAVKRLSSSSGQGTNEFMNEIRLISKLQHRNLVRLLGYCIEGEEKLLIYEFMLNKSLDVFLYDSILKFELDWPKRFDIIQGIARGLLYLHRDSRLRVIHRDLKVCNILLDEKMNPKISDFGLARMFQGTQYQENTRRVVGTLGYMSPEYAWAGLFSEKSDIYSFGVLMLEIISGKRISRFSFGDEGKCLLAYAWDSWCETGGSNLLDGDLTDSSCQAFEVARCVQIGLLCVQHEAVDRPNTLQVLSMITSTTDLPIPKQPLFAVHTLNDESMSQPIDPFSVNDITQSEIQGR